MIRDPSDGTVREVEHRQEPLKTNEKASESDFSSTALSGLAPEGSNRAERLKYSREWLEKYHRDKSK